MKIVIGATGASGSIYLQRLLEQINASEHEVHLVMTVHARQVADHDRSAREQLLGSAKPASLCAHY